MRVDLFDFDLPADRIAVRPAEPRDRARLLVVEPGDASPFRDQTILDLPRFLNPGDVLVVNDTRVIPARLHGIRTRGPDRARIEATLHKREGASHWRAFVRPAKKLKPGDFVSFSAEPSGKGDGAPGLTAEIAEKGDAGEVLLAFVLSGEELDAAIEQTGETPIPPYIAARRSADGRDARDYQTLFAQRAGAVAAPTAGLHFTPGLVAALEARGVLLQTVTLHVGAGTFLPVKANETSEHKMHTEWGEVGVEAARALNNVRASGGRIVAVGTTSLRIIESAADAGGVIAPFSGDTSIFITPGYAFKAVNALLTNFHLPRSTLFMLVAAFSGLDTMQAAYSHAIAERYRFYSYGDACLLLPAPQA